MMKHFIETMKLFVAISLWSCESPTLQSKTENKILSEEIIQNKKNHNDLLKENFIVPIGNTYDSVEFKENGNVNVMLFSNRREFDITQLHQNYRLYAFKKLFKLSK